MGKKFTNSRKQKRKDKSKNNKKYSSLGETFDEHLICEFEKHDVDATMKTMVKEPYVHHIPMLTGGEGFNGVYNFYKTHFVCKMPADTKVKRISRTVGRDQVVDELILSFTHDRKIDFMIPGIQPTGKYVELPHVVVMKFNGNKIAHEHILGSSITSSPDWHFTCQQITSSRYSTIKKASRASNKRT
jgi:carboxymethylenebutenolidase